VTITVHETPVAFEVVTALPFDEAVERCRAELAAEGFAAKLARIDSGRQSGNTLRQ